MVVFLWSELLDLVLRLGSEADESRWLAPREAGALSLSITLFNLAFLLP